MPKRTKYISSIHCKDLGLHKYGLLEQNLLMVLHMMGIMRCPHAPSDAHPTLGLNRNYHIGAEKWLT
jgi:hypothetical protein